MKPFRKAQHGCSQASKVQLRTISKRTGRYREQTAVVKANSWESSSQFTHLDCLRAIQEIEASTPAVLQRLGPLVPVVIAEVRESIPANLWRIFEGYDITELERPTAIRVRLELFEQCVWIGCRLCKGIPETASERHFQVLRKQFCNLSCRRKKAECPE